MTPESRLLAQIRNTLGRLPNVRLFRNQVGFYKDNGRAITYGLCPGSADLIGWVHVKGVAVFLAIEVKTPIGRVTPAQHNFLNAVRACGGYAGVARTVEDAMEITRGEWTGQ